MNKDKKLQKVEKGEIAKKDRESLRDAQYYSPTVDIYEKDKDVYLKINLPGVEENGLDVKVADGILTITAQRRPGDPEGRSPVYMESEAVAWQRSFELSDDVDPAKAKASLTNGVLTLIFGKTERSKTHRIKIQSE